MSDLPQQRRQQRVMLMRLSIRTSAKGAEYLSGWLGTCKVIGFKGKEPDKYGNEQWEIYAQEPEPREGSSSSSSSSSSAGGYGDQRGSYGRDDGRGYGSTAGDQREARPPPDRQPPSRESQLATADEYGLSDDLPW